MFYSHNADELMAYGYRLGQKLQAGDVLVLTGNLGAGKTTLTKGIAKGLDINQMIKSPTYTIVREYEGRLPLYHLDVYRIGNDPDSIDLDDLLLPSFTKGIRKAIKLYIHSLFITYRYFLSSSFEYF